MAAAVTCRVSSRSRVSPCFQVFSEVNVSAQVNIAIMRTFVRLRQLLATHEELARKLDAMEHKYDTQFKIVFDVIRKLMEPPPKEPKRSIGFKAL